MDISLVVLAAGIGSRFGGVKQLEPVGRKGEIIIDYSVHDAVAAGFTKIVYILRRDIYSDFMDAVGSRLENTLRRLGVKWEYVFQELIDPPEGREKPWGTGQALLACKGVLNEPFAVVNADDYYGREAFAMAYGFLKTCRQDAPRHYGMIGFILKNTLSDVGGVTRGICSMNDDGLLTKICETRDIVKIPGGAAVRDPNGLRAVDENAPVSMNMWMLTPEFVDLLEDGFRSFRTHLADPMKDEYLLPEIVDRLLQAGLADVKVLKTHDRWFGMTYREDLPRVRAAIEALYDAGVYQTELYSDMQ